jgi:cytochrome c-type protein NapB
VTNPGGPLPAGPDPARLFAIGTAVAVMLLGIYVAAPREGDPERLERLETPAGAFDEPVAAEALVFRERWGNVAAALDADLRSQARPRTLAIYRRLRAFPGAPPRIPHGLTHEEFLASRCNVCHERGGFAARFGAYVPLTPHPEYENCLQCHVPEAMSIGISPPDRPTELVCRQCHVNPDRPPPSLVSLDWVPRQWPALGGSALPGAPPVIPHELQLRGDCVSCHGGPAAVRELRTTHPERVNCRQCHVPAAAEQDAFVRPEARSPAPGSSQ